ncbi:hypothetical protein MMC07_003140 [Pseudocyphellaria aurata]|nr:hypothetical protein [Pseudocyphellaria aurata]
MSQNLIAAIGSLSRAFFRWASLKKIMHPNYTAFKNTRPQAIEPTTRKTDWFRWEGTLYARKIGKNLAKKHKKIQKMTAKRVSCAERFQKNIAIKDKEIARLKEQLASERLDHQIAMRDSVQDLEKRVKILMRSWQQQNMDDEVSWLAERLSNFHIRENLDSRITGPTNSIEPITSSDGRLEITLIDQLSKKRHLGQKLIKEKGRVKSPEQSPATCQAEIKKIPVEVDILQANSHAKLARFTTKTLDGKRQSEEAKSGLESKIESKPTERDRREKASQEANQTFPILRNRKLERGEDKRQLLRTNKVLEAQLIQAAKRCRGWSKPARMRKATLR